MCEAEPRVLAVLPEQLTEGNRLGITASDLGSHRHGSTIFTKF